MIKINLLPRNYKPKKKREIKIPLIISILIVYSFMIISLININYKIGKEEKKINTLKTELKKYKKTEAIVKDLERKEKELKTTIKIIIGLLKTNPKLIKEIDNAVKNLPEKEIFLEKFNCNLSTIQLQGNGISLNSIAKLIKNLEKTGRYKEIVLKETKSKKIDDKLFVNFTLTAKIKNEN